MRERDKREKSEEKIDCHHQDSNQGPSLVASDALTTELWCSRHPSRDCSTFSSDFVAHTSCESTQAGGTQPSLYPHIIIILIYYSLASTSPISILSQRQSCVLVHRIKLNIVPEHLTKYNWFTFARDTRNGIVQYYFPEVCQLCLPNLLSSLHTRIGSSCPWK